MIALLRNVLKAETPLAEVASGVVRAIALLVKANFSRNSGIETMYVKGLLHNTAPLLHYS